MRHPTLTGILFLWITASYSQVGIGTTTPNSKSILDLNSTTQGFLVPRMTWQEKMVLALSSDDAGMMVYQTDQPTAPNNFPKGLYFFNGTAWIAPINNGTGNGHTLRWDGKAWVSVSNLFNTGSGIGIGIQSPNTQLQIHSIAAPTTQIQITNSNTNGLEGDGLLMGITLSNQHAHILQQEKRALWFGTDSLERVRIDSIGNVGIGISQPEAKLHVNGTAKFGTHGNVIHDIIRSTIEVEVPALQHGEEGMVDIACPNTMEDATVYVSPASNVDGLMIGHARVSEPGNVEVKFMNMSEDMDAPMNLVLHITVIQ